MNIAINSVPEDINRSVANLFCNKGSVWGDECLWYHANWNLLRKLNLVSTPFWHEQFYIDNIKDVLQNNAKILICGAADEAMCAVLLKAIGKIEINNLDIYMIDLCKTPLVNSFVYSFSRGYYINIRNGDAKKLPFADNYFSLIVTDAFLTRFSRNERKTIVENWYRVLKPSGSILTTGRINNSNREVIKSNLIDSLKFIMRAVLRSFYGRFQPIYAGLSAFQYVSIIESQPMSSLELKTLFTNFSDLKISIPSGRFREVEQKQYARIKIVK